MDQVVTSGTFQKGAFILSNSTRLLFDNQKEPVVEIQYKNHHMEMIDS